MPSKRPDGFTDTLCALPYRPTFKLTRVDNWSPGEDGWKSQAFKDDRGNEYEREHDGKWERWWLIESRKSDRGKILYKAKFAKSEPESHGDCLHRIDDLRFMARALLGLVTDARERGLFSEEQLNRIDQTADHLFDQVSGLVPAIAKPQSS